MSEILVGEYLLRRIKEIGIDTIFGVPGDYELALLDLVPGQGLTWMGTPNELVGAYAADGYARIKGAAALLTTFGPGELSALCGIGGSFTEFLPVLHIVGYPTTQMQASGKIYHHTLADRNYEHYVKMSAEICCATTVLNNPTIAASEIDRVLNAMLYHSQPGYIGVPADIVYAKISNASLDTKLVKTLSVNDQDVESTVVRHIVQKIEASKSPVIIVDGGAARLEWEEHVEGLINALKVPVYVTTLGKGAVKENNPLFGGAYVGLGSWPHVREAIEKSDCVLWLGNFPSDYNTGIFTENVKSVNVIDFQRFHILIDGAKYQAKMKYVLPKLINAVESHAILASRGSPIQLPPQEALKASKSSEITHEWLWQRLTHFLQPGDAVVVETGTSQVGILETTLPPDCTMWTQAVYGSIGYAAGAALGGSIAAKETGKYKRMILITGEGSLQLTVQAFSLLNRFGVVPVVFVINNNGYTIERYLHGLNAPYNTIPAWDYGALFKAFSPEATTAKTFKVNNAAELDSLLSNAEFRSATYPQCVEMVMDAIDFPTFLLNIHDPKTGGDMV